MVLAGSESLVALTKVAVLVVLAEAEALVAPTKEIRGKLDRPAQALVLVRRRRLTLKVGVKTKKKQENLPAPTCAQIASRVQLGIIPTGYPDVELTYDQQELVKDELLKRVLQQRKEMFKPKFVYCKARTGHLRLIC